MCSRASREGGGQPFVLRDGLRELAFGLEDALLEGAHSLGRVLEPATQDGDLLVERLQLPLELANLTLVLGELLVTLRCHGRSPPGERFRCRADTTPRLFGVGATSVTGR